MENVINFNEFTRFSVVSRAQRTCWLCQKPSSGQAVYCEKCGAVQPVAETNHFIRLGLEQKFDLDAEELEGKYALLKKALSPESMSVRGIVERGHAERQLAAVNEAYENLCDPIKRGRYWLALHGAVLTREASENPAVGDLREELKNASQAHEFDRVAQKSGQATEKGVMRLMHALRAGNWDNANDILCELDGLDEIYKKAREKRAECEPENPRIGISRVD
jgi:molecular chaperone HscB